MKQLQENKIGGSLFESKVAGASRLPITRHAYLKPLDARGNPILKANGKALRVVMDLVKEHNGKIRLLECKSSLQARLTPNQERAFPAIEKNGFEVASKNKTGLPYGSKHGPTKVEIIRQDSDSMPKKKEEGSGSDDEDPHNPPSAGAAALAIPAAPAVKAKVNGMSIDLAGVRRGQEDLPLPLPGKEDLHKAVLTGNLVAFVAKAGRIQTLDLAFEWEGTPEVPVKLWLVDLVDLGQKRGSHAGLPERFQMVTLGSPAPLLRLVALLIPLFGHSFLGLTPQSAGAVVRCLQDPAPRCTTPSDLLHGGQVLCQAVRRSDWKACEERIGGVSLGGMLEFPPPPSPQTIKAQVLRLQDLRKHPQLKSEALSDSDLGAILEIAVELDGWASATMDCPLVGMGCMRTEPAQLAACAVGLDMIRADVRMVQLLRMKAIAANGIPFLGPSKVDIFHDTGVNIPYVAKPTMVVRACTKKCLEGQDCGLVQCDASWSAMLQDSEIFRRLESIVFATFLVRWLVHIGYDLTPACIELPGMDGQVPVAGMDSGPTSLAARMWAQGFACERRRRA